MREVFFLRSGAAQVHVANIDEAFLAQKIAEDVQRGEAGVPWDLREPQRGRLRRRFFRQCPASACERRRPGEACGREENPAWSKCRRLCMLGSLPFCN